MEEPIDTSTCTQFIKFVRDDITKKSTFIQTTNKYDIYYAKDVVICTGGAKATSGHRFGLIVRLDTIKLCQMLHDCTVSIIFPTYNLVLKKMFLIKFGPQFFHTIFCFAEQNWKSEIVTAKLA